MELENIPQLRASDADRDRVAEVLGDALSEGRLTPEEHAERLDRLYAAKTYAELEPLTDDLPRPQVSLAKETAALPPPVRGSDTIQCVLSGAERKGRWLVDPVLTVNCLLGGVDLDFRTAVLTRREIVVNINCALGGVDIIVPPGVRVENQISAILGDADTPDEENFDPQAPVIRLTGHVLLGAVSVERKLTKEQRREQRAARKAERRARRSC